jgi:hypothetical protein
MQCHCVHGGILFATFYLFIASDYFKKSTILKAIMSRELHVDDNTAELN